MPRDYAAKPQPCGLKFCPVPLRILWPDLAFEQKQIGAIYGVGGEMSSKRAEALGIFDQRPATRRKAVYSRKRFESIWTDLTITKSQAAALIGLHPHVCARHARRMGIKARPLASKIIIWPEDFNAMWDEGVSTQAIARVCKCHPETAGHEAKRRGLVRRDSQFRAKVTLAEFRLLRAMKESARTTQLAYEITGRETRRHFAEIKRLAA
jgi:hypothetical protein